MRSYNGIGGTEAVIMYMRLIPMARDPGNKQWSNLTVPRRNRRQNGGGGGGGGQNKHEYDWNTHLVASTPLPSRRRCVYVQNFVQGTILGIV